MADNIIGVDIGGTFTDGVLLDLKSGQIYTSKALTTPQNPMLGLTKAVGKLLEQSEMRISDIDLFVHATTLITNAIIERKIAKTALLTTKGFGDTIYIRDEHRYDMYDLQIEYPDPLVSEDLVLEVNERITATGRVLNELNEEELKQQLTGLRSRGVSSIAISFLHSYVNNVNESKAAKVVNETLNIPLSVSSDVSPQIREYPRTITTICNAATLPIVGPYIEELKRWLSEHGFKGSVFMMLSNGGVASLDICSKYPVRLIESGPAAGVLAGCWYAQLLNEPSLLCLDMGGTTAKCSYVENFEPTLTTQLEVARIYRFKKGSGFPLNISSVDLVEIGAGGGSIAWRDSLGLLKVGPESAGALPGPACYALGGTKPTVTDADVVLGYLNPDYFLGGEMRLDPKLAMQAIERLADDLGLDPINVSMGIFDVVNNNMSAAARIHAIERGIDVKDVPLIAFGGAAAIHGCAIASLLESSKVIFPANAGVLSALGMLVSPIRLDFAKSYPKSIDQLRPEEIRNVFLSMYREGENVMRQLGVSLDKVKGRFGMDARYLGQGNEVTVWLDASSLDSISADYLMQQFEYAYRKVYGMTISGQPIEVVTWRTIVESPKPQVESIYDNAAPVQYSQPEPVSSRDVYFIGNANPVRTAIYRRFMVKPSQTVVGPCIIEDSYTSCVIPPGWICQVLNDTSLVASRVED